MRNRIADRQQSRALERWFNRRGMAPLLSETRHRSRAAVRVVPVLVVLFALVMIVVVPDGRNTLLTLISVGALLLTWVIGSLIRHGRPFAAVRRIGWLESMVFVLVPTVTALVVSVDGDVSELLQEEVSALEMRVIFASMVFMLQVTLLSVVYAVTALGLTAAISSIFRELFTSLSASGTVLARTLPLLLGVVTFIYFSAEIWRAIGRVPMLGYVGVLAVFVLASAAFLLRREHLSLDGLARFETREELLAQAQAVPLQPAVVRGADDLSYPVVCPLGSHQEGTIRATVAMSRLIVASTAGVAVAFFFLLLGFLTIPPEVVKEWSSAPPKMLFTLGWAGISIEHVRVAFFLGVFAGMYYAVVSATDPALRQGLKEHTYDDVRQACAARVLLLHEAGLTRPADAAPGGDEPETEPTAT